MKLDRKNIVISGANGFIGKNLYTFLKYSYGLQPKKLTRDMSRDECEAVLKDADIVFHLAGTNRSDDHSDFSKNNVEATEFICQFFSNQKAMRSNKNTPLIVYSSSAHVLKETIYGESKLAAEEILKRYSLAGDVSSIIFRFPGIFGKWSRPNYNSIVATMCRNAIDGKDTIIDDDNKEIDLIYIDDVVEQLAMCAQENHIGFTQKSVDGVFSVKLGDLKGEIYSFAERRALCTHPGSNFILSKQLYSTFLSFLSYDHFTQLISKKYDKRGMFTEFFKANNLGQISCFTINPGCERGGHFHNTKCERFLVVSGSAKFILTNILEPYASSEISVEGFSDHYVEIPPGWSHRILNTGECEVICMVWANEIYNPEVSDTIPWSVAYET